MYKRNNELMVRELDKNQNPEPYKIKIKDIVKDIEERVYWFNTQSETTFLGQFWGKQTNNNDVLRERVAKITEEKFEEFARELEGGQQKQQLQVKAQQTMEVSSLIPDIPAFNANYFSPSHPKTKEVQLKLKQINKDLSEYKQKTQRIRKQQMEKKQEKLEMQEEIKKAQEEEKKQKYHSDVQKKVQMHQIHRNLRNQQHQKFKQFLKVYKQTKPKHVLMEEEYHEKVELPMIEENKKKLKEFKGREKPSLEEINDHERHYLQMKQNKEIPTFVSHQTVDVGFKSRFYLEEHKKLLEEEESETIVDQIQKKKRYSEIVKQNFKPRRSMRKTDKEEEKTIVKEVPTLREINQKGEIYLEYMRSIKKKRQNSTHSEEKSQEVQKTHYIDYLQDLKSSRPKNSSISHDWARELRNNKTGNEYDRREKVMMLSRQLQEKAYRQEQFVSTQNYTRPQDFLEKKKQIDETLMESIKAKVAVLKDGQ